MQLWAHSPPPKCRVQESQSPSTPGLEVKPELRPLSSGDSTPKSSRWQESTKRTAFADANSEQLCIASASRWRTVIMDPPSQFPSKGQRRRFTVECETNFVKRGHN